MKFELQTDGKVIESNGIKQIVFDNPKYYRKQVQSLHNDEKVSVIIKNKTKRRSKGQNAYWHAVCFPEIGERMGESPAEAKKICKSKFILPEIKKDPTNGEELEIQRGTSELDVDEGWEFTVHLISLAHFLGGEIKTPCEAGYICGRRDCPTCAEKIYENDSKIQYPKEDIDPNKTPF